jgi:hypothetical protein
VIENCPDWMSFRIMDVMRYPEITKKTSTPTNPPEKPGMPR